jgi:hypothetical protein
MSATTYYADAAVEQLAAAQRELEAHAVTSLGYCLTCRTIGPCRSRMLAESVFKRSMRLPQRRPGHTRPELLGALFGTPVGLG